MIDEIITEEASVNEAEISENEDIAAPDDGGNDDEFYLPRS